MAISKVGLTTGVTGTLATGNGGTGSTAATLPASLINNTSIGNVTALPAGVGGKILGHHYEVFSVDGWARETEVKKGMDESQITGSTSSYARKYAMNGLFAIDDVKDADSMDNRYTITDKQKERYQELLNSGAYSNDKAKINKWWKGFTTYEQAEAGLDHMQRHVDDFIEKHKERG